MLTKRIIPCLDVKDGRVVKGTNFVDLRDAGDPVELASRYDKEGADELVFLDITASSDKRYILRDLVERTAEQVFIPFTVGGGIQDLETIRDLLQAGADKVSINTRAVSHPEFISEAASIFGSQCIVAALDARSVRSEQAKGDKPAINKINQSMKLDETSRWEVYIYGGRSPTGIDAVKWGNYMQELGAGELLLTSMDRDGTRSGYDIELIQVMAAQLKIPIIASGGAGTIAHIRRALEVCDAALLASLLHYREVDIEAIKTSCLEQHIPMRLVSAER